MTNTEILCKESKELVAADKNALLKRNYAQAWAEMQSLEAAVKLFETRQTAKNKAILIRAAEAVKETCHGRGISLFARPTKNFYDALCAVR